MKFKSKLPTKFLTDTEPAAQGQEGKGQLGQRISTSIKVYSRVKTKAVGKFRRERRKKFETQDEQEQSARVCASSCSDTPVAQVQTERYVLSNVEAHCRAGLAENPGGQDLDLGVEQVESSQQFINRIKSKLRLQ